ncbi:hypothetical protein [Lysinibacillus pakistanensis]|uniref:hypothetical protein n=1 Tax=Lysinibacillus pakistanensis TaxID=759811 RepID=UPI003D2CEC39
MAIATVKGMFLKAFTQTKSYQGNDKTSLYVDVYQSDSEGADKLVQVKTDDLSLYEHFAKDYDNGSLIELKVKVNAYQNKAYFKLLEVI